MEVATYQNSGGDDPVFDYIREQNPKAQRKILAQMQRLEHQGFALQGPGFLEKMQGVNGLYELKISHNKIEYRIFCGIFNNKWYALHAFKKKRQRTNQNDISVAIKRLNEIKGL